MGHLDVVLRPAKPSRTRVGSLTSAALRSSSAEALAVRWLPGGIVVLGLVALLWGLILPIGEGLRGDEVVSVFRYSGQGPSGIWGAGYVINDHMLFEFLTWTFRTLTGDHSFAVNRFWAIVPAFSAATLLSVWAWRRLDPWAGALTAVLFAAAPVLIDLSTEGRGYGLAFFGASLMIVGADWVARTRARRGLALFVLGSLIGLWTLPVFILVFIPFCALLLIKRRLRRRVVLAAGFVGVLTLVFYLPVLSRVLHYSGKGHGAQLGLFGFIVRPLTDLLQPSVQTIIHPVTKHSAMVFLSHVVSFNPVVAVPLADVIAGVVVFGSAIVLLARRERFLAAILVLPVLFTYIALELARSHVISRFASFLLPGLLLLCAAGPVGGARMLIRSRGQAAVFVALATAASLFVLGKAFQIGFVSSSFPRDPMYSNQPLAFNDYVSAQLVNPSAGPKLANLCQTNPAEFWYLAYGPQAVPPGTLACFKRRHAWGGVTLTIQGHQGPRPATVWLVGARGAAAS